MGASTRDLVELIERALPPSMAMADDPVGVQIMTAPERQVESLGVAYEITERVLEEGERENVGLIVAFHPLLYPALRRITTASRVERCAARLVKGDIALWIAHTIFDAHPRGTSRLLAEGLGLQEIEPLEPNPAREGWGMGAIGTLDRQVTPGELVDTVRRTCNAAAVRLSRLPGEEERNDEEAPGIGRVAVLGGSGMSFYGAAVRRGAEAYVTADVRYHDFHSANDRIPVIDPGHAESERFVVEGVATLLQDALSSLPHPPRIIQLDTPTNPVGIVIRQ